MHRRLGLFLATLGIAALLSATAFAERPMSKAAVEKAYGAALVKAPPPMTSTFIPLNGRSMDLYRAHKNGQRSPAVVVLNGTSKVAKGTFAIMGSTDKFGLVCVFDRATQQELAKGSIYIGPNAKKTPEVKWFNGAPAAAAPAAK
jgi:hypothetical protein